MEIFNYNGTLDRFIYLIISNFTQNRMSEKVFNSTHFEQIKFFQLNIIG